MAKKTLAQKFADIFARFTSGATAEERATGERMMDAWLKRNSKTRMDIPSILAQAVADDAAAQPPPPPSDPRDAASNPFDSPEITPADLVEEIVAQYVWMPPHAATIFVLMICFTHVYTRFRIAPRVALVSENPNSGKSTALEVARCLVFRPNQETLGTGAAVADFLNEGPCTVLLDELDQVDAEARRRLQLLWNLGYSRKASYGMMVGGRRTPISLHAPVFAAGIGRFLAPSQKSRTFTLEMEEYTAETKPTREFDDADTKDLNAVYIFLRHWTASVKLDPKPTMPPGVLARFADNVKGLLAIADSCSEKWGVRAREAVVAMFAKEKAERPQIVLIRHGLLIFEIYELDQIGSVQFNKELFRLDLSDARWTQYRDASGTEYAHPLRMDEQATLLGRVGIHSMHIRPAGKKQCNGYKRAQFEEARRKYAVAAPEEAELRRERLRLVGPSD